MKGTVTKSKLRWIILRAKVIALLHGVDLLCDIKNFVSTEKLDCVWYSDIPFAEMRYRKYRLSFICVGDVRATIRTPDEGCVYYTDKTNNGAEFSRDDTFRTYVKSDTHMRELIQNGLLIFNNNNWIDVAAYYDGDSLFYDTVEADTVLDCIRGIKSWCKYLKTLIADNENSTLETFYGEEIPF